MYGEGGRLTAFTYLNLRFICIVLIYIPRALQEIHYIAY